MFFFMFVWTKFVD